MATASNDISELAPDFVKLTTDLLAGDIWQRPGLSQRDKCLVTLTVLATLNRIEQIDYYLGLALDSGLTQEEIVAALTHIAFYAGWPSAYSGMTHFKNVLDQRASQKR